MYMYIYITIYLYVIAFLIRWCFSVKCRPIIPWVSKQDIRNLQEILNTGYLRESLLVHLFTSIYIEKYSVYLCSFLQIWAPLRLESPKPNQHAEFVEAVESAAACGRITLGEMGLEACTGMYWNVWTGHLRMMLNPYGMMLGIGVSIQKLPFRLVVYSNLSRSWIHESY